MSKVHKDHMVWMDLEMSGLDPEKDKIIEIATVITDSELELVDEGPDLVIHQSLKTLKGMDDWNQKQHAKSGLIESVKKSKITVKQAENKTLEFVSEYCLIHKSPLCGSSIHHDRRFLAHYMPTLHQFLHYRLIDVSTIKGLVERWYPKVGKSMPKRKEMHRALGDVKESIEDLKYLRKTYFR
jgi:oligoribonuclease